MTDQETPQPPSEEPPVPTAAQQALERMKMEQAAFIALIEREGIDGGLAQVASLFQALQLRVTALAAIADPSNAEAPDGTTQEMLDLHEGMHEALTQARLRLHETGSWIDTATAQRRTLAFHVSRKNPPPAGDPDPDGNGLDKDPPDAEPSGE